MWNRLTAILGLLFLPFVFSQALSAPIASFSTAQAPPTPLPASVLGASTTLTASNSSSNWSLPASVVTFPAITIQNTSASITIYYLFGAASCSATTGTGVPLAPGTAVTVWTNQTCIAVVTASSTATVNVYQANGPLQLASTNIGTLTAGDVTAALGYTPPKIFNPVDYGAKCDGTTNDLTALNNMATAFRAVDYGVIQGPTTACYFSGGTVNFENFQVNGGAFSTVNRIKIDLRLICSNPGGVCVSTIGSRNLDFMNLVLTTPHLNNCNSGDDANIGIQFGRPTPNQTAARNSMYAPNVAGCFSYAAVDNYASEVFTVFGGEIVNGSMTTGANGFRSDCDNHFNTLTAIQSVTWTSGTFASCDGMAFVGTTVVSGAQNANTNAGTIAGNNTLSFASIPSSVAIGDIVSDRTNNQYQIIPYGTTITNISGGTTVTLSQNVGGAGVSSGDQISFAAPGTFPVWLDGNDGFEFTGPEGYIDSNSNYAVELCVESAQPPKFININTHIETYPSLIGDILVGCTSGQSIYHLERKDYFDEASFGVVVPDFANSINTVELDDVDWRLNPAGGVTATFSDFGTYDGLGSTPTVASGGSGCTTGVQTFTLQGGTGTAATVSGTVTAGALGGTITIVTAGAYIPNLLPSATPSLSGGGCSVAPTLNATYPALGTQTPISFANGDVHESSSNYSKIPAVSQGLRKTYGTGANALTALWGNAITVPNLPNSASGKVGCENSSNQLAVGCAPSTNVTQTIVNTATGTASTTQVMMGVAAAITPTKPIGGGNESVRITISGDAYNSTSGDGGTIQIYYGTGTAPINGAAFTGTACGKPVTFTATANGAKTPFTVNCWASGLVSGTAIWSDLGLAAVTGGTANVENITVVQQET